jgi:hypothetical protein
MVRLKWRKWNGWNKHGHASVNNSPCCSQLQTSDTQCLIHYKFIPEGHTVNKCILKSSVASGIQWEGNVQKRWHSSAPQHTCTLVIGGQKVPCQVFEHKPYFPALSLPDFSLFPKLKLFWRGNDSQVPRKYLQKWQEHWQRYRITVSRNASKSFKNVGKSVSLPKGTTLKEMLYK